MRKIRITAAIILLTAIFLPLSECSLRENHTMPDANSISQRLFPQSDADFKYQYGYRYVDFTGFGAVTVFAFAWPLIFALAIERYSGTRARLIIRPAELVLCA